jgi:hypothetical protein
MTRKSTQQTLRETHYSPDAKLDEEAGIVRNVKVLGSASLNGRTYSPKAMKEALSMYAGADIFLDHRPKGSHDDRPVRDKFGWLESVREENGELRADFHYLKEHSYAKPFEEGVRRRPKHFGLSHDAEGQVVRNNGKAVVESIIRVNSVDLVSKPATTQGLFESEEAMPTTVKKLVESLDAKHPQRKRLMEMMGDSMMAEAPVDAAPEINADEQAKIAIHAMVAAVLEDDKGYPDSKAKLAKIAEILDAKDMLVGDKKPEGEGEGEPDPKTETKESKAMQAELTRVAGEVKSLREERDELKTKEACRALLESKNRPVDETKLAALAAVPESVRVALVESWPEKPRVGERPKTSPPAESISEGYDDHLKKNGGTLAGSCKL